MRVISAFVGFGLAVTSITPVVASKSEKVVRMVKVEDMTFRVLVQGEYAKAASKGSAIYAPIGARYYALAKRAVEEASGCKVTDTNTNRANLYATLDCAEQADEEPGVKVLEPDGPD